MIKRPKEVEAAEALAVRILECLVGSDDSDAMVGLSIAMGRRLGIEELEYGPGHSAIMIKMLLDVIASEIQLCALRDAKIKMVN